MTDGMGRNGSQIKQQYGLIEEGPKGGRKRGVGEIEMEEDRQGQTGSGSHIWRVKLAVMNPAEWPYLCSFVCLPVVSVVL